MNNFYEMVIVKIVDDWFTVPDDFFVPDFEKHFLLDHYPLIVKPKYTKNSLEKILQKHCRRTR